MSLRTRLVAASALAIALVVGTLTAVGLSLAERRLAAGLRETARLSALAVADDLELRRDAFDPSTVTAVLHEFLAAAPSVRTISVFRVSDSGVVFATGTSSAVPTEPDGLVERAVAAQTPLGEDRPGDVTVAVAPLESRGRERGAVLVAVSLNSIARFRAEGRLLGAGVAVLSIVCITLLVDLLARRLVHDPLRAVVDTVDAARRGDLSHRARVVRPDEIGEVAQGLNSMLTELDGLQASLRARIDAATQELRERNEQLRRSYEAAMGLQSALARAQDLATVGQTMANVAHQIGTPLNLASAHVQLLQRELADPTSQRRLTVIAEQLDRVSSSVSTLLERTRPKSDTSRVPLRRLLARLADTVLVRVTSGDVTMDVRVPDDLPDVAGDETQLELALLNLVVNALDAMPTGGRLTIAAHTTDGRVNVTITDTGRGIPAELQPRIFEPWFTTKPAGRGTGLGLGITRDVIERAGGTVSFTSAQGTGTTFTVSVPIAEEIST